MPMSSYSSGWVRGSSTASLISVICCSRPPTSAYDSSGAFSTCAHNLDLLQVNILLVHGSRHAEAPGHVHCEVMTKVMLLMHDLHM